MVNAAIELVEMVKAFATGRLLSAIVFWQAVVQINADLNSIDHRPFGNPSVNVLTSNRNLGLSSIKGFVFQFTQRPAINRIGKVRTKILNVKMIGTSTNLLIRPQTDLNRAMLDFRMLQQIRCHRYDLSHA